MTVVTYYQCPLTGRRFALDQFLCPCCAPLCPCHAAPLLKTTEPVRGPSRLARVLPQLLFVACCVAGVVAFQPAWWNALTAFGR